MRNWILGTLAAVSLAAAAPAVAQGIQIGPDGVRILPQGGTQEEPQRRGGGSQGIGEQEAVSIARGEGVREIETVRRSERSYRVVGYDRRGDDIQVDIDRRNGAVISVR